MDPQRSPRDSQRDPLKKRNLEKKYTYIYMLYILYIYYPYIYCLLFFDPPPSRSYVLHLGISGGSLGLGYLAITYPEEGTRKPSSILA